MEKSVKISTIESPADWDKHESAPRFVSDVIADLLGQLGYGYATLNPGSSFRGLHDSLVNYHRNAAPKVLLCTHEEIAVSFAHGYAKASRKPALAICHDLVGLMHASMAIYDAWCDRTPMLILGGSGPSDPNSRRWIDFIHAANTQGDLVRQFVKWEDEPATPAAIVNSILRAHRIALTPPTGPVYVSLDKALMESPLDEPLLIPDVRQGRYAAPARIAAESAAVERTAETILAARFPLIIAGGLSYDPAATPPLIELVEAAGAAYCDQASYISFPTGHPHNLNGDNDVLHEADVVLAIDVPDVADLMGMYGDEEGRRPENAPPEPIVIDLSLNDFAVSSWSHAGGDIAPADVRLVADPIVGMRQLVAALRARDKIESLRSRIDARSAAIAARHHALRKRQREAAPARAGENEISRTRLVDALWEALDGRPSVLSGRSLKGWPEGVWEFRAVGEFLGWSGGGGIGYGPGAAVGAALATHESARFPVAILGDGDMAMAAGAIWTAVHYRIPLLAVIDNNRSFMNDEEHQRKVARIRERPLANAWIGTAMFDPEIDFAALSRAYGAWAPHPIDSARELTLALKEAIKQVESGKVAVVDVRAARPW